MFEEASANKNGNDTGSENYWQLNFTFVCLGWFWWGALCCFYKCACLIIMKMRGMPINFPLWASLVLLNVLNIMVIRIGNLLLVIWHVLVLNNDNVDKLFVKELQTIPLILKLYVWDNSHYTSTFGQSCFLSFLRCKRLTTGKESSLHWFKYKNLYENESFRHWF